MDGTGGLDRTHVDGPGTGRERRSLVQLDRQGVLAGQPVGAARKWPPTTEPPGWITLRPRNSAATWTRTWTKLAEQLRNGTYVPQAIRRVWIPKPGTRTASAGHSDGSGPRRAGGAAGTYRADLRTEFAEHSYGFRPGRGCKDALREVDALLKEGYHFVVDADLKSYFDTIPHDQLMTRVRERIADRRVLALIESFLKAGILSELGREGILDGAPQGAVLSPLLSNIYLNPLGPPDGPSGDTDGALCGRLCDPMPEPGGSRTALTLVQQWTAGRTDSAPGQDATCRRARGRIHLPGLQLRPRRMVASDAGRVRSRSRSSRTPFARRHAATAGQPQDDHHRRESHASWLVRLLQAQLHHDLSLSRRLDTTASAEYSSQASRPTWGRKRSIQSTLAQRLLYRAWLFSLQTAHASSSTLYEVRPSTGEPDAGDPPARFGREGELNISPYPINKSHNRNAP